MKTRILEVSVIVILMMLFQSCTKDRDSNSMELNNGEPSAQEELVSIDSYLVTEIDGELIDSIKLDCENSIQLNQNRIWNSENAFLIVQGIKFEIDENLSIRGNFYIYDEIDKPDLVTTEILKNYIEFNPEKIIFDLEIMSDDEIFRNNSLESIKFSDNFLDSQEIIAENQILSIKTETPFTMNCFGKLDVVPTYINYSGDLKTNSLDKSIEIRNLQMKINLREL